ncbi:ankyrin repeat domain-containing protein [Taibaiella koreensis]|uniref:ankyrin repeat domain-containing protein n=1 Tax=Taibaiella koreensis TaxID=1268548 RepID=UPI001968E9DA|nr:ankyrin repeat domain-containing protein [Taibaiella koreensis]
MMDNNEQLRDAIRQNDPAHVKAALAAGTNKEARDAHGKTPLLFALSLRSLDAAVVLIDAGADVNAQDDISDSPFLYAGAEGLTDIVRRCMQAGADYRVYNRYGGSALIPACERGHVATVAAILEDQSFPINHVNRLGWTGLLETVILGDGGAAHLRIMAMLIAAGADVNLPDKDGVSALQHAIQKGQKEMAQFLEQAGAR